ncbi:helix-turn-helix domain-containing protein [Kitasatospora sp. NPDC004289]
MDGELLPLHTIRISAGMSFEPIPGTVDGVCRELAQELRTLASRLGISMTRYARDVHRDRSTLSRWLSGVAVPPADFLDRLTSDVEAATGLPLTHEAREHLRRLHRSALAERNPRSAELQSLRDRWSDADQEARDLRTEVDLLKDMLRAAQRKAAEQEVALRQLERGATASRLEHRAELALVAGDRDHLRAERDGLLGLVERLREELREAEARQLEAEHRCHLLEHQLETAERAEHEAPAAEQTEADLLRRRLSEMEDQHAAATKALSDLRRLLTEEAPSSSPGLFLANDHGGFELLPHEAVDWSVQRIAAAIGRLRAGASEHPAELVGQVVVAMLASSAHRPAFEVAELAHLLSVGPAPADADALMREAASGKLKEVVKLAGLLALAPGHEPDLAALLTAAGHRPPEDVVTLLIHLRGSAGAVDSLLGAISYRPATDVAEIVALLHRSGRHGSVSALLRRAALRPAPLVMELRTALDRNDQAVQARELERHFRGSVGEDLAGLPGPAPENALPAPPT